MHTHCTIVNVMKVQCITQSLQKKLDVLDKGPLSVLQEMYMYGSSSPQKARFSYERDKGL